MATATWNYEAKHGAGWNYDDGDIAYDGLVDTQESLSIYYEGLGQATVWTNESI